MEGREGGEESERDPRVGVLLGGWCVCLCAVRGWGPVVGELREEGRGLSVVAL